MYLGQLSHVKLVQVSGLQHDVKDRKKERKKSAHLEGSHFYRIALPEISNRIVGMMSGTIFLPMWGLQILLFGLCRTVWCGDENTGI